MLACGCDSVVTDHASVTALSLHRFTIAHLFCTTAGWLPMFHNNALDTQELMQRIANDLIQHTAP